MKKNRFRHFFWPEETPEMSFTLYIIKRRQPNTNACSSVSETARNALRKQLQYIRQPARITEGQTKNANGDLAFSHAGKHFRCPFRERFESNRSLKGHRMEHKRTRNTQRFDSNRCDKTDLGMTARNSNEWKGHVHNCIY